MGLLAEAHRFEELGGHLRLDANRRRRAASSWAQARAMAKRSWTGSPVVLRATVLALVLISLVSILVFERTLGLQFSEAVYFVTTTLTTTGYGDITVRDHGPVMHLYASVLMLLGSTTMAVMFAFVTDFFVRERFRELSGKPELPDAPHVIVAGLGDVGLRVAETFNCSGPDAVVMEREPGPYTIDVQGRMPSSPATHASEASWTGRPSRRRWDSWP
ncbi:MAG: ion channel [Polyangiaceae bacterium]